MKNNILLIIITLLISSNLFSQNQNKLYLYPDEFSELDDIPSPIYSDDEFINATLEVSRRHYIQAIIFSEKKDTIRANDNFLLAIRELNKLVSYPNITDNSDFTDLAAQLTNDYEVFAEKYGMIDDSSPIDLIREKLLLSIESESSQIEIEYKEFTKSGEPTEKRKKIDYSKFQIPIIENSVVNKSIQWLTQTSFGRRQMTRWLERSSKYFPMMKRIARDENVPEEIVHLSMIESALDPNAVSKARAVGLWQFMDYTGKEYGLNLDKSFWVDERRDPEKATRAAMKFLRGLYNKFGDWHLALASYNCGAGRVSRTIKKSRKSNPNYWEIRDLLPRETRGYVPMFISTAIIAMDPESYGFDLDTFNFQEEYKYDVFTLNEPVNLNVLAQCAGIPDSLFRLLNPELIHSTTPLDKSKYLLKIPYNSTRDFVINFAALSQDEKLPFVEYQIGRKESLNKIALKYNIEVSELTALNNIKNSKSKLKQGKVIKLPISKDKFDEINLAYNTYLIQEEEDKESFHFVKRGESLYSISKKYDLSINELKELNDISRRKSSLQIGQKLIVSSDAELEETENKPSENITSVDNSKTTELKLTDKRLIVRHKVKKGENLDKIASKYQTSKEQIIADNSLKNSKIKNGSYLKIYSNVDLSSQPEELIAENTAGNHQISKPIEKTLVQEIDKKEDEEILKDIKVYEVAKGETLFQIANKFDLKVSDLAEWNNLENNEILYGQVLKLYNDNSIVKEEKVTKEERNFVYHTVKRGETLGKIAANYGISLSEIKDLNKLKSNKINRGAKIKVSVNDKEINLSKNIEFEKHKVRSGETISEIADKYGVSSNQIKSWNNLNSNKIMVGQDIFIKEQEYSKGSVKADESKSNLPTYYSLKRGENLYSVSRKFSISLNKIKDLNPKVNPKKLQVGEKIRVK